MAGGRHPDGLTAGAEARRRPLRVLPGEGRPLFWSFLYFFCLLSSYYLLRPLRDEMGILGGVAQLHWTFTGTFVATLAAVPLFSAAASRFPRSRLLPIVYGFFVANILGFYLWFQVGGSPQGLARAFFIWTSVFNLFVVSVFWSFMADLYRPDQAARLFGLIAAGGSLGAVSGPALSALLATALGPFHLLPVSAGLLLVCILCIHRLLRLAGAVPGGGGRPEEPLGGDLMEGLRLVLRSRYLLGICLFIWLFTTLSTFVYFEQAHILAEAFDDSARRTQVFALMDLAVNLLTILGQLLLTARLIARFGLALTLALIPLLVLIGFAALAVAPVLPVLVVVQVLRRSGNYALTKPAREMLFTVVDRPTKYKAKNLIDTLVYRGGDAVSAWLFAGLQAVGLGLAGIAVVALPLSGAWAWLGWRLGRRQQALAAREPAPGGAPGAAGGPATVV